MKLAIVTAGLLALTRCVSYGAEQAAPAATSQPAPAAETAAPAKPKKPEKQTAVKKAYPAIGAIERLDPAMDALVAPDAKVEKLAGGFQWSEGPVWVKGKNMLLFSDVPRNVVFRWKEGLPTADFIFPSGYTGSEKRGGEGGSNGLAVDKQGNLYLCQHGDHQVARLVKGDKFETVARYYNYRRFNSPNDLAIKSNGDIYFTDPSYGLEKGDADPEKELAFNGVYRVTPKGVVTLLTSELTFPNGIAFSPDEKIVYVAVSDPKKPVIMAYTLKADGTFGAGRVFFDAKELAQKGKGLPDGLKIDKNGNLFATGPGGVLVITPAGKHLGTISTGELVANCAFGGEDGSTLYMTSNMYLCRVKTLTKGAGF